MNKKPKNLTELTKSEMAKWLNSFDTVLTDIRGVLWLDDVVMNGAPEAIALLQTLGKEMYFVTNNALITRRKLWEKVRNFGFNIDESRILTPTQTIVEYLLAQNFRKKVYVIGTEAVHSSLTEAGIENFGFGLELIESNLHDYITQQVVTKETSDVGAVIVGFDANFTYAKLLKATNYIASNADCLFMTTNWEKLLRYPEYRIPGTGALLAALETCVKRKALQFGKPNPEICQELIKSGRVVPARTLMIGDVCEVDILFGHNSGFQTLLVGTGSSRDYELKEVLVNPNANPSYIPHYFVPSLGDITKLV